MKATTLKRLMNQNAIILALHWLSEDDGLSCHATNKQIAAAAGRSEYLAKEMLGLLEARGDIAKLDYRDGVSARRIVLMNHPEAKSTIRHIRLAFSRTRARQESQ